MKKFYVGAALAAILTAVTPVTTTFAAAPAAPAAPATPAAAALVIPAADVTRLKDWITAQKTASARVPETFRIALGTVVPMSIMLRAIGLTPAVAAVGMNQYAVIADKMVLVNPTNRQIVYVFA